MTVDEEEEDSGTKNSTSDAMRIARKRGIRERILSRIKNDPQRELTLTEIVEGADIVIPFLGVKGSGKTHAICAFLHWALAGNMPRAEIIYQPHTETYKNYAEEKSEAWYNKITNGIESTGQGEIHPIKLMFHPRRFADTIDREVCVVIYDISGEDYSHANQETRVKIGPRDIFEKFMVGVTNPIVLFDIIKKEKENDTFELPKQEDWPSAEIKKRVSADGTALQLALEKLGNYKEMEFALVYAKSDEFQKDSQSYVTTDSLAKLLQSAAKTATSTLYGKYRVFKLSAELYRVTRELPNKNPEVGASFEAICRYFARRLHDVKK